MSWFKLTGDERLGRCATDGCGGQPTLRFEDDGIGSNYCSGCGAKIGVTAPDWVDEKFADFSEEERARFRQGQRSLSLKITSAAAEALANLEALEREAQVNNAHANDQSGPMISMPSTTSDNAEEKTK